MSFTYDNDAITLHGGDNTTVYALTYGGTAVVKDAYTENLPSDFMGSFAAVQTDGNVTRIAKTDMEYTQGYTTAANLFLSDEIPFEVAYADREYFTVYFNGEPLSTPRSRLRSQMAHKKQSRPIKAAISPTLISTMCGAG